MSKSEKVLFLSKLFFFTGSNELIKENLQIADSFYEQGVELVIVAQLSTKKKLETLIPKEYDKKITIVGRSQEYTQAINSLNKKQEIVSGMMGIVNEDAIFAFNCKIPLFNPEKVYNGDADISEKVKRYGLPIIELQNIIDCFKSYEIHKGNYFHIPFGDEYSVMSLNNANTYYKPEEEVRIKEIFETNLKGDKSTREQRILLLLLFHLMNEITSNKDFEEVDYWGTFPSSDSDNVDTSVFFLKEAVRVINNGGPRNGLEILIRKSSMQSKHSSGEQLRLANKSNKDLDTLIVNLDLIEKIRGKVICIIDDYITNGYSAEATKHLLLHAGVKKVIFISIGKFGKVYYATNYAIQGDSTKKISYKFINEARYDEVSNGMSLYDSKNDTDILSFGGLV